MQQQEIKEFSRAKIDLILAAEKLFGQFGVNGVSLRQISQESGHKNTNAAQYHFCSEESRNQGAAADAETKDNLIRAIIRYRRPRNDDLRAIYLRSHCSSVTKCSVEALIAAIFYPFFAEEEEDGQRRYSRFLSALLHHDPKGKFLVEASAVAIAPETTSIYEELRVRFSHLSDETWNIRMKGLSRFGLDMIANFNAESVTPPVSDARLFDEIITMITAAFTTPESAGRTPLVQDA